MKNSSDLELTRACIRTVKDILPHGQGLYQALRLCLVMSRVMVAGNTFKACADIQDSMNPFRNEDRYPLKDDKAAMVVREVVCAD